MAEEYRIGSGFTDSELNAASFWVKNHVNVRRVILGTLVGVSILSWGYALWTLLDTYVISYPREARIPLLISRDHFSAESILAATPQALQGGEVALFPNTGDREDLSTQLTNPNGSWWAEFTYFFQSGETKTPAHTSYVLPHSTRPLTELGWSGNVSAPNLVIEDITWHRVDPTLVGPDYDAYALARTPFTFDNITYKNDLTVGTQTVGQTDFVLNNPSGYGYWAVELTIVLYQNGSPVAITTVTQRELKPGEQRPVSINWFENVNGITDTTVTAQVNILDPSTFLPTNRF